jgi:anti-sigma factor ChrR (cupin superfamily)
MACTFRYGLMAYVKRHATHKVQLSVFTEHAMTNLNASNFHAEEVEAVPVVAIGPGCTRRDLQTNDGVRAWIVDIAPGAQWPHVDHHDALGEEVFVVSGELIEGNRRYGAGQHLSYAPHSSHRPRSDFGVRLFGFNLLERSA